MANICVFCSSQELSQPYVDAGIETGTHIGIGGHRLVYGAGENGLMGVVANAVQDNGGKTMGIIPNVFLHLVGELMMNLSLQKTCKTEKKQ